MTMGVFSHLQPKCSPCEAARRLGVGAIDTTNLVSSVGGVPTLNAQASQAVLLLLGGRYPQMTGSGDIVNGTAVTQPGLNPEADYQTLIAAQQGDGPSVLEQLKTLPPGAVALFDFQEVVDNLNGKPEDLRYAIARTPQVAKVLGPQAQLVALQGGPGSVAQTEEGKSNTGAVIGGLAIGGGVMLVTGNPIVGALAGVVGGVLIAKTA